MIGTRSPIAWLTAVPILPEELSTCSSAGERRSRNSTAPSAPSTGSRRATLLISLTASLTRRTAGCDLQPNACLRNRARNSQRWLSVPAPAVPMTDILAPGSTAAGCSAPTRCPLAPTPRRRVDETGGGVQPELIHARVAATGRSSRRPRPGRVASGLADYPSTVAAAAPNAAPAGGGARGGGRFG